MPKHSREWGACINKLMRLHDLTFRSAEQKANFVVSHAYISEWAKGKVPQYSAAIKFLEHFPREEAIECLQAAGYPVPDEWREEPAPSPTPEQAIRDLRTTYDQLTDEQISYVEDLINEIKAERRRKYGKPE